MLTFNRASAPQFIINSGIIDEYLDQISAVTEGRVRFVDPLVTNRDGRAQLDLVLSGQADGAYIFNGFLAETHPLLQLPMLPLLGGTAKQTAVSMWRLHEQYLAQTDYMPDVHLLGFVGAPAAHIWRTKAAPVSAQENIVEKNEYTVPYFDGLDTRGAEAVKEENAKWMAEFDEQRGQPATLVLAHGAALAAGIWAEDRTVTEIDRGVYTPTFSVVLSRNAWSRIAPQDQQAIQAISGEALSEKSANWDAFDNTLRARMLGSGLDVVKADIELLGELQDRSRLGVEAWIHEANRHGISGFEAVNSYFKNLASF